MAQFKKSQLLMTAILCLLVTASLISDNVFAGVEPGISLRKFPFPYRCMIAWMNDTDALSPEHFEEVHRFLNTVEKNIPGYGDGVGLDIGDSFWYMAEGAGVALHYGPRSETGLWERDNEAFVLKYLKAGWIDSLHSYSSSVNHEGFSFARRDSADCIDWLKKNNLHMDVWIDHGDNSSNVGTNWGHGKGSIAGALEYHDDITFKSDSGQGYGFRFGWIFSGREHRNVNLQMAIGGVGEAMLSSMKSGDELTIRANANEKPVKLKITGINFSARTLYVERKTLGRRTMLEHRTLLDSERTKIWEFSRITSDRNGKIWYANSVGKQVSREDLDYLVENGLYEIFAVHLGYWGAPDGRGIERDIPHLIPKESISAFRLVKFYQDSGKILVARGSRLLKYNLANDFLEFGLEQKGSKTGIVVKRINDPWLGAFKPTLDDLRGITFYCNEPEKTEIYIGTDKVEEQFIQRNPADFSGQMSIGIKWYDPDYTDYSRLEW